MQLFVLPPQPFSLARSICTSCGCILFRAHALYPAAREILIQASGRYALHAISYMHALSLSLLSHKGSYPFCLHSSYFLHFHALRTYVCVCAMYNTRRLYSHKGESSAQNIHIFSSALGARRILYAPDYMATALSTFSLHISPQ